MIEVYNISDKTIGFFFGGIQRSISPGESVAYEGVLSKTDIAILENMRSEGKISYLDTKISNGAPIRKAEAIATNRDLYFDDFGYLSYIICGDVAFLAKPLAVKAAKKVYLKFTQDSVGGHTVNLQGDDAISFPADTPPVLADTAGITHVLELLWNGYKYIYCGVASDVNPGDEEILYPIVTGLKVEDANPNKLVVTFDREVVITSVTGWTFKVNGVTATISSVAGTGTDELTFTLAANVHYGQALRLAYNGTTGDLTDLATNEMPSIPESVVINEVTMPEVDTAAVDVSNPDEIDITFTHDVDISSSVGVRVTVEGEEAIITSVAAVDEVLTVTLSEAVTAGDEVKFYYDGTGNLANGAGVLISIIPELDVTNSLT